MFDLADIFQFIIDGLNQSSFPEEDFISHIHGSVFHVFSDFGYQMNTTDKECIKERL